MSDRGNNTEQLAAVMSDADCASSEYPFTDESRARAILASDWLRDHDAVVADRARREALREAAELVSDANEQGLGLDAAYRSILREATTPQPQEEQQP